jgi:hypothetical protein
MVFNGRVRVGHGIPHIKGYNRTQRLRNSKKVMWQHVILRPSADSFAVGRRQKDYRADQVQVILRTCYPQTRPLSRSPTAPQCPWTRLRQTASRGSVSVILLMAVAKGHVSDCFSAANI